jgi:hypothetical protein
VSSDTPCPCPFPTGNALQGQEAKWKREDDKRRAAEEKRRTKAQAEADRMQKKLQVCRGRSGWLWCLYDGLVFNHHGSGVLSTIQAVLLIFCPRCLVFRVPAAFAFAFRFRLRCPQREQERLNQELKRLGQMREDELAMRKKLRAELEDKEELLRRERMKVDALLGGGEAAGAKGGGRAAAAATDARNLGKTR